MVRQREDGEVLNVAELMFKLSAIVTAKFHVGRTPVLWTFGKHSVTREGLALSSDERQSASVALAHCTTHIIALQLDTILGREIPDRFDHPDDVIRSACWIVRLIRNAFAHDPLQPVWKTYPECDRKIYLVPGLLELDTTGLNGKPVERMDYGGPNALLRLSEFVRSVVLGENRA